MPKTRSPLFLNGLRVFISPKGQLLDYFFLDILFSLSVICLVLAWYNLSGHYQSARQMHLDPPDILHSDLSVVVFQEVHSLSDRLQHFLSRHPQQRGGLSEMPGNQRFQSRHCRMPDQQSRARCYSMSVQTISSYGRFSGHALS